MSTDADSMSDSPAPPGSRGVNYLALTFALMGGATVWLVRLIVNSALVNYSCAIRATWPLWLTTVVTTLIGCAALAVSWGFYRMTDEGPDSADTARWLGLLGVMFNVLAIAGIILESAPIVVLDICRSVFSA
jgi:magnesium-transporting ATPase (P-type)